MSMTGDLREGRMRTVCIPSFGLCPMLVVVIAIGALGTTHPGLAADTASLSIEAASSEVPSIRDEPVLIAGSALPGFAGQSVDALRVFRFDEATNALVPIPFQVDERFSKTFNPGTNEEFQELVYDVFGEEDGLFDADDELVFLFGDAGEKRAPAELSSPSGADPKRYEIRVEDSRSGLQTPDRWVYVLSGTQLARSQTRYLNWGGLANSDVSSDLMVIAYDGPWRLTELRVRPPCGNGNDLIDRLKGRAGVAPNKGESEEIWNQTSRFLGGKLGPIRAIRYVRGAASGTNTIHHDLIYRRLFVRRLNLRVHPLNQIWFYFDWLPRTGLTLITKDDTSGWSIDGVPEVGTPTAFQPWQIVSGPDGGLAVLWDVPPSPYYEKRSFYYKDDANYNDAPHQGYTDDDDASIGSHGIDIFSLGGTSTTAIPFGMRVHPLCASQGSAQLGATIESLKGALHSQIQLQDLHGAPRELNIQRVGSDLRLSWRAPGGQGPFKILGSKDASLPTGNWKVLGTISGSTWVQPGAGTSRPPMIYFYRVDRSGSKLLQRDPNSGDGRSRAPAILAPLTSPPS